MSIASARIFLRFTRVNTPDYAHEPSSAEHFFVPGFLLVVYSAAFANYLHANGESVARAKANNVPVLSMGEYIERKKLDVDEIRALII